MPGAGRHRRKRRHGMNRDWQVRIFRFMAAHEANGQT